MLIQDDHYLYTVLSVSFPPTPKAELLLLNLDVFGVCVSSGSACSSGADKGSHVIEAIGADPSRTVIRFSFSHTNNRDEIDYTLKQLKQILPELVKTQSNS
jgi:cysteine desulfurase